ncbi:MAG: NINE protein [Rhodobacteraceae bacterium]|nr:NINE protein [Paracoccaceae bacterium]
MEFFDQALEWAKANNNLLGAVGSLGAILTLFLTNGSLLMGRFIRKTGEAIPQSIPPIDVEEDAPDYGSRPAVACLPFRSSGLTDPLFADGLLDDITSLIQRDRAIAAAPRTSVQHLCNSATDIRAIARKLGVGYMLEGSLRQGDNVIRLNIQLMDRKGASLWADRFDVPIAGGLDAQERMAQDVAQKIHQTLVPLSGESVGNAPDQPDPVQEKPARSAGQRAAAAAMTARQKISPEMVETATGLASTVGLYSQGNLQPSGKSRSVALVLCGLGLVPGIGGLQRFYVGRPWTGLLYFLTLGLFYVGTVLDLLVLVVGAYGDGKGRPVIYWTKDQREKATRQQVGTARKT